MKNPLLILFVLLTHSAFSQGTLEFEGPSTAPDPDILFKAVIAAHSHAPPDVTSGGLIEFSGQGNIFVGGGGFGAQLPITFIRIEDGLGTVIVNADIMSIIPVEGSPYSGVNVYFPATFITSDQIDQLRRGEWSVNIGTPDYPEGAMGGQFLLVPEPRTWMVAMLGAAIVVLRGRPTRR